MFGMELLALPITAQRNFDTWQIHNLRSISRIPAAHVSHISNETTRKLTQVIPLSNKFRQRRLRWYGHIARRELRDPVHWVTFERPQVPRRRWPGKRRADAGRPRTNWSEQVHNEAVELAATSGYPLSELMQNTANSRRLWRSEVQALRTPALDG